MIIRFVYDILPATSLIFDNEYEDELKLDLQEKKELYIDAVNVWLTVDGALAGEALAQPVTRVIEQDPDLPNIVHFQTDAYINSTTILPAFQGRGLGTILKAFHLGLLKGKGFRWVCGHSTSPEMNAINTKFGAEWMGPIHAHWYQTDRMAQFYRVQL